MKYFNIHIICAAVAFGLLGSAKGLDESIIATVADMSSFIKEYQLHASYLSAAARASRLSNITSIMHLGSLPGGFIAFFSGHWVGPLWTMRQLCLVWIVGVVIFITSAGSQGQLMAGRFIMGVGVGQAGVIGPIYLAEVAPTACRGLLVGLYASSEYVGVLIGYFAGWGVSLHISGDTKKQWIIPECIHIMMAGVLLIFSFGCVESPRYLAHSGCMDNAARSLAKLRGLDPEDPRIAEEMQGLDDEIASRNTNKSKWSFLGPWKALFARANLQRWMFLLSAQLLSQWSGTNAITTYAPKFFALLNVTGSSEELLKTAIFGVVKLVSALIGAFFFIDRLGRKHTLLGGIILQIFALVYIAIFMTAWDAAGKPESANSLRAAKGSVAALYVTGSGYAFGWNCVQYLINAEILPAEVRTLGTSLLMCVHYANKFALVKAVPTMLLEDNLQPQGTFWFFFAIASIGLVWCIVWLPETSQKSLEETSNAFKNASAIGSTTEKA